MTQGRWLFAARVLALLTVALVLLAAYVLVSATGSRTWPTVEGTELSSRFVGVVSPVPPSRFAGRGTSIVGRWIVEYQYEVAGEPYRGQSTTEERPGSSLLVYYSPENPAISTIAPGVDLFLVAASLVVAGVFYLASRFCYGASGQ